MSLIGKRRRLPCHLHGNRLYCAPGWREKLAEIGLSEQNHWDTLESGEAITLCKRTRTRRITLSNGECVYFKRYLLFGKPFRFFLRPGQAAVEIYSYQEMAKLGLPIAEPIAVGEIRRWGSLFAGCIVTREIPGTITLKEYAIREWNLLPENRRRQAFDTIATTICRHLQTMHRNRFFHFDPKWRNILIRRQKDGTVTGLWWIDAPRGRRLPAWFTEYGKVRDLAGLCRLALSFLSRTQRLRFLFAYCGPQTSRAKVKRLARKIDRFMQPKMPQIQQPDKIER
jgi:hypothetical protein